MQKKHPKHLEIVFALDNPSEGWKGPSGFISADLIKEHISPPSLQDKVKIFVCGTHHICLLFLRFYLSPNPGPPGQVAAISGKKAGMAQGELGGVLKELGYSADQVSSEKEASFTRH